jgi:regulator of RNase E activity RraA
MELDDLTRERLRHVSTATLCTQLFKRGFRNVYVQGIERLARTAGGNLVGPAFTMRNIPAREDIDQISAFENPEHPQRKGIESVPPGYVLVTDCRGERRVASGGEILTTRLKVRGAAGLVSDGPVRDSQEIRKLDFDVFCAGGSAPLNLIHHHAADLNVPIGCGDAPVFPRDVIVGDAEGVVVVPGHLADEIANEAFEMTAFEDFVTEEVMKGRSILGLYPATDPQTERDFAAWLKANGR